METPPPTNTTAASFTSIIRDVLVSWATDYRFTLVFRVKAQSRAMGNTADT